MYNEIAVNITHRINDLIIKELVDLEEESYLIMSFDFPVCKNSKGIFTHISNIQWDTKFDDIRIIDRILRENPSECHFVKIGDDEKDYEEFGTFKEVYSIITERMLSFGPLSEES